MQPFSNFALAASILTCALGAIILCLLVYRHGFGDVAEDASEATVHRAYMTRLGHLAGAVCFAVAAGFTIVALVVQSRAPVTSPIVREPTSADVARQVEHGEQGEPLERMRADQAALTERLRIVGERLQAAEATIDRLRSEQVRIVARLGDVETSSARLTDAERFARSRPAPGATVSARPATPATTSARPPSPAAPAPSVSAATRVSPKAAPAADSSGPSVATSPPAASPVAPRPSGSTTKPVTSATPGSSTVTSPPAASPVAPRSSSSALTPAASSTSGSSTVTSPPAPSPAAPRSSNWSTTPAASATSGSPTVTSSPAPSPVAPRSSSSSTTPAASPLGSTAVASPQPAPAVAGQPADAASPGSGRLGGGGSASEPGRDSAVAPESARGDGGPTSQAPVDAAREDRDLFVQAQRAMHSTPGNAVTRHVERFAKDVKDVFMHFGRSVRNAFE